VVLLQKVVPKYNRATGSKAIKAPVTKKSGLTESEKKRKNSFCDRMEGMKRKMTNIKKKNNPNSRINLALKKWRC
jgi:type IV pilus biogenesis protein CpaD/CtpE